MRFIYCKPEVRQFGAHEERERLDDFGLPNGRHKQTNNSTRCALVQNNNTWPIRVLLFVDSKLVFDMYWLLEGI